MAAFGRSTGGVADGELNFEQLYTRACARSGGAVGLVAVAQPMASGTDATRTGVGEGAAGARARLHHSPLYIFRKATRRPHNFFLGGFSTAHAEGSEEARGTYLTEKGSPRRRASLKARRNS